MLENYDLKPYKEVLEEYGLTPEDETGEGLDEKPEETPHEHFFPRTLPPLSHRRRSDTSEDRQQLPLYLHHTDGGAQQAAHGVPHRRSLSHRRYRRGDSTDIRHQDLLRVAMD